MDYYRRSLPRIAAVLQPLYAAATEQLEHGQKMEWTPTLQKAFDYSKQRLRDHTLLVHPDPDAPLAIVTDPSLEGVGGALEQFDKKTELLATTRLLQPPPHQR